MMKDEDVASLGLSVSDARELNALLSELKAVDAAAQKQIKEKEKEKAGPEAEAAAVKKDDEEAGAEEEETAEEAAAAAAAQKQKEEEERNEAEAGAKKRGGGDANAGSTEPEHLGHIDDVVEESTQKETMCQSSKAEVNSQGSKVELLPRSDKDSACPFPAAMCNSRTSSCIWANREGGREREGEERGGEGEGDGESVSKCCLLCEGVWLYVQYTLQRQKKQKVMAPWRHRASQY